MAFLLYTIFCFIGNYKFSGFASQHEIIVFRKDAETQSGKYYCLVLFTRKFKTNFENKSSLLKFENCDREL
jgi:hypothetical protein